MIREKYATYASRDFILRYSVLKDIDFRYLYCKTCGIKAHKIQTFKCSENILGYVFRSIVYIFWILRAMC